MRKRTRTRREPFKTAIGTQIMDSRKTTHGELDAHEQSEYAHTHTPQTWNGMYWWSNLQARKPVEQSFTETEESGKAL